MAWASTGGGGGMPSFGPVMMTCWWSRSVPLRACRQAARHAAQPGPTATIEGGVQPRIMPPLLPTHAPVGPATQETTSSFASVCADREAAAPGSHAQALLRRLVSIRQYLSGEQHVHGAHVEWLTARMHSCCTPSTCIRTQHTPVAAVRHKHKLDTWLRRQGRKDLRVRTNIY